MITLGIETSCDETAAAVAEDGRVLSSEVSSSVHLHSRHGGVVPEIASRYHTEYIYPVLLKALDDSGKSIADIDLVAVTKSPGLPGSLLVGIAFAKAVALAAGKPIVGVDHVQAHVLSSFLGGGAGRAEADFPILGMVVSGGHTSIYLCKSFTEYEQIGGTKDDAVGEAFDKVAKIMGLGYPGGPLIEKRAASYNGEDVIAFPRALIREEGGLDFSFSGLKTAVMYYWKKCDRSEAEMDKIAFSFQEAVIDVILRKALRAADITGIRTIAVGGGVIHNAELRSRLVSGCAESGITLSLPGREYCADNAAMIAVLGQELYVKGKGRHV